MRMLSLAHTLRPALIAGSLAFAGSLGAQGLSYDMSTTATMPDRTGAMMTRNMSTAHGQFAGGNSRIDFTQSLAPAGMMGTGTYMISSASRQTVTSVDPAKHEYTVINLAELGKTANDMQAALGGVAKTEITDVKVGVEDLGAGEPLDGYATYKYRLTQSFTMKMTVMGRTISSPSASTTDIWVAPQLDGLMDPSARPPVSTTTGPMAELTAQLTAAYSKVRKGLMLKRVTTSESGAGSRKRTTTMTTTITNVKKTAISPSVFEVPAGYTKVAVMDAMGAADPAAQHRRPQ
ncbi:MAG: DUF4412 domain-containing protein [Gemmatimonadaceae bacterium]|nr:DUF4412 domain-containing protein [Gemmatimonadaceae bacterium]